MKLIRENVYLVTYTTQGCSTCERCEYFMANTLEEALVLCRKYSVGCDIKKVSQVYSVLHPLSKTITIEV